MLLEQIQKLTDAVADAVHQALRRTLLDDHRYKVGEYMFFRCVTYHYVGRVEQVGAFEILIRDPVWVAESGKWQHAYETGTLVDYMDGPEFLLLGRLSIVDAGPWIHGKPPHRTS